MKGFYSGIAALCALCASSVSAQTGYVINERVVSPGEMIEAADSSGWIVTSAVKDQKVISTLYGPAGYTRDISAFVPAASSDPTVGRYYPAAVDIAGDAYFAQSRFSLKKIGGEIRPIFRGNVIQKLPLGASSMVPVLSYANPDGVSGDHVINSKGQILHYQYATTSSDGVITLTKIQGDNLVTQLLTLPSGAIGERDEISLKLDDEGNFIVYRKKDSRLLKRGAGPLIYRTKIKDLCSGTMSSSDVFCATKSKRNLLSRQHYQYTEIAGGTIVVGKLGRGRTQFMRLEPTTFKIIGSFSVPDSLRYNEIVLPSEQSSKISATVVGSAGLFPNDISQLHLWGKDGGKKVLSCAITAGTEIRLGFPIKALAGDGLLVEGQRGDTTVLLELLPADVAGGATGTAGQCR
jgi:hypothetical protein